jgi:60 kDa SS-A/Ro ribonucleoprotein
MGKFNQKPTVATVTNHQGGTAFKHEPKMELIALLAAGLDGRYYEKETERETRLFTLINEIGKKDPTFVAKALVYARAIMGQRSVTHVGAVAAAKILSGNQLASRFFTKRSKKDNAGGIVLRLDDMFEIIAYYQMRNPGKPLPNSIKRGFKSAIENADRYELAKYQGNGKEISLVDVVNLVHPKPSAEMQGTFKELMKGELKQFNTAEDKNTKSGLEVAAKVKSGVITKDEAKTELAEAKAENWKQLITEGTIGYFALLRNLSNIVTQTSDEVFTKALELLTNEKAVLKSLVFPHQIDIAFETLLNRSIDQARKMQLLVAVNKAYELAIPNLTGLFTHGRTAVVIDTSASMTENGYSGKSVNIGGTAINSKPVEKAALIGATLAKGIGADFYHFASTCEKLNYNPVDSVNSIKKVGVDSIGKVGHGTEFDRIFGTLKGYDRIFIISDMQGGDSITTKSAYQEYVRNYGQPFVYAIDITGYGTKMFKNNDKVMNLFGYSADIYESIKTVELDPNKILKEIESINI